MRAMTIFFVSSLLVLHAGIAFSGAPYEVTYQGRLLQNGDPVTTPVNIYFELYDAVTAGTRQWDTTVSAVTPDGSGIYTVTLGSEADPIPTDFADLWLQVRIGGSGGITLSPRQKLTSAPFALNVGTGLRTYARKSAFASGQKTVSCDAGDLLLSCTVCDNNSCDDTDLSWNFETATCTNGINDCEYAIAAFCLDTN